jgi:FkbM family methyltransferase
VELLTDLIIDVGVNNGDDAAYYLFKGYRVLGIEADPTLMAPLRERFGTEIAQGRLTLLNVALAPERKSATFWICEDHNLWNSFDRNIASQLGYKCHAIETECWPLRDIFSKYGVPYYLKLSLHGQEHFCLADIEAEVASTYLSLELPRDMVISEEILARLLTCGYDRFKVIDQTTQKQLAISPSTFKSRLSQKFRQVPHLYKRCESFINWSRRLAGPNQEGLANERTSSSNSIGGWVFPEGSSGPFAEETHGCWQRSDEIHAAWKAFVSGETDQGPPRLSVWHDLHATRTNPTKYPVCEEFRNSVTD